MEGADNRENTVVIITRERIANVNMVDSLIFEKIYLKEIKYKARYKKIGSAIQYLPVMTSVTVENDSEICRTNNS